MGMERGPHSGPNLAKLLLEQGAERLPFLLADAGEKPQVTDADVEKEKLCKRCNGDKKIQKTVTMGGGMRMKMKVTCPRCQGSGTE